MKINYKGGGTAVNLAGTWSFTAENRITGFAQIILLRVDNKNSKRGSF